MTAKRDPASQQRRCDHRVLFVDEDTNYSHLLTEFFEKYGFFVSPIDKIDELPTTISRANCQTVIMDQFVHNTDLLVMLPQIRSVFSGALIILAAHSNMTDRILALEGGADDFMCKSMEPREILARLRALSRRTFAKDPSVRTPEQRGALPVITRQGWTVNAARREVRSPDGRLVPLTGLEFDLLLLLFQSPGVVIEREELAIRVLRRPISLSGRSLENLISRVRAKFEPYVDTFPFIKSVRGKGYVLLEFP
jgi:two-component system, OmpR family, response regulator